MEKKIKPLKISQILKESGLFSTDIKGRFNNGQIQLNGIVIKADVEISVAVSVNEKDEEKVISTEVGDFVFNLIKNDTWKKRLQLMGVDAFFGEDCDIKNDLSEHLKSFTLLRFSKRDAIVLNKFI